MNYLNDMTISHIAKAIPYDTGALRSDGAQNYGFMDLKMFPDLIDRVAELKSDAALLCLVKAINSPETGLMTIGCSSAIIVDPEGYRKTGYVEISFTTNQMAEDAQNCFPLFYHFSHALSEASFDQNIHFSWDVMPAQFVESDFFGFTIAINLNTRLCDSSEAAEEIWAVSANFLAAFLKTVPKMDGAPLL